LLRKDVERWGWKRALLIRLASALRRYAGVHVYRINVRPLVRRPPGEYLPEGVSVRLATREVLLEASEDPELDLSPEFVRDALARGDVPFGAFEGERLVAYLWRTYTAAPDKAGLWARVGPPYVYAYKAFTRASHRGKRIHGAITFLADAYLLDRGFAFEVGYTEPTNYSAIRAAELLGRRKIGYAGYAKWFGRIVPFRTPAVREIGAELFQPRRMNTTSELNGLALLPRDPQPALLVELPVLARQQIEQQTIARQAIDEVALPQPADEAEVQALQAPD
jgi:hypothetical protein